MIPERLSHYRVVRKIGVGGMGEVYLAEDEILGRRVAVKVLPERVASDGEALARFRREARAISALNHPNILTIHEYSEDGGIHFFVTEYLSGRTLREIVQAGAAPAEALAAGIAIGGALAAAHAQGVVHRDLKPENVFVTDTGLVKVLDFGLAKKVADVAAIEVTKRGSIVGTVPYMAPEQLGDDTIDGRTDVFSLGVTLYEMFEGRRPFGGATAQELITAILTREPAVPVRARTMSPRLARLIMRMLAKSRQDRPDAAEVQSELESIRLDQLRDALRHHDGTRSDLPTQQLEPAEIEPKSNLPAEVTPLVGREEEMAAIRSLLRREDVRFVSITGAGGTGKSRLALRVASQLSREFRDGVWFVPLDAVAAPEHVPAAIANALGVVAAPSESASSALAKHLRSRAMLLVIDNFEHVLEASSAIASLLASAPALCVLITSQVPLHIAGEHEYAIDPLPKDSAVALFVARARQVRAQFELNETNSAAVAEICRLVDGLPLAVELAAVRVKLFTPSQIVERLRDPIGFLTGGARDLAPRQRALRSAVEWSIGLLDEFEQCFFARLAIFHGGATIDAAEMICDVEGMGELAVDEILASLVDKNLARREVAADGGERFTMLAGIRAVAAEKLDASGEREALAQRHAAYYASLLEQIEPQLVGAAQPFALRRVAAEENNIRAAIENGDREIALRLAAGMWRFWDMRGAWREGRATLERLLLASKDCDAQLRAKARYAAGVLADAQGDFAGSHREFGQYLDLSREIGNPWLIANALNNLAISELRLGRLEEAARHQTESLEVWRSLGNTSAVALACQNVGNIARARGFRAQAREAYDETLASFRAAGDARGAAHALMSIADLDQEEGSLDHAAARLDEALSIFMNLTDHWNVANCMAEYGRLLQRTGDRGQARELLAESAMIFREVGDVKSGARVLDALALLALEDSDEARAGKLAGAAHAMRNAIGAEQSADQRITRLRSAPAWQEGLSLSFDAAVDLAQT